MTIFVDLPVAHQPENQLRPRHVAYIKNIDTSTDSVNNGKV